MVRISFSKKCNDAPCEACFLGDSVSIDPESITLQAPSVADLLPRHVAITMAAKITEPSQRNVGIRKVLVEFFLFCSFRLRELGRPELSQ